MFDPVFICCGRRAFVAIIPPAVVEFEHDDHRPCRIGRFTGDNGKVEFERIESKASQIMSIVKHALVYGGIDCIAVSEVIG